MQRIPGVIAVGASNVLPVAGDTGPGLSLTPDGGAEPGPTVWLRAVNGEYFSTLGIPFQSRAVVVRQDRRVPSPSCRAWQPNARGPANLRSGKVFGSGRGRHTASDRVRSGRRRGRRARCQPDSRLRGNRLSSLLAGPELHQQLVLPHQDADAGPIVPQVRAVLRGLDEELPFHRSARSTPSWRDRSTSGGFRPFLNRRLRGGGVDPRRPRPVRRMSYGSRNGRLKSASGSRSAHGRA